MRRHQSVFTIGHFVSTAVFFAVVGLVLTSIGVFILYASNDSAAFPDVDAVITDIQSAGGEDDIPVVTVRYTVDGQEYTSVLNAYSSTFEIGGTVTVKYNPDNPADIRYQASLFGYILVGAGIICCIGTAVYLYKSINKYRREKQDVESWHQSAGTGWADNGTQNGTASAFDEAAFPRKLYYHVELNTFKPSCFLEDETGRTLYEAKVTKYALLGDVQYDFINYETGKTQQRSIGKTVTTNADSLFSESTFTVDGINVDDILHKNGIDADISLGTQFAIPTPTFRVSRFGQPLAIIDLTNPNAHGENGNSGKSGIPVNGFFDVQTNATELDLLFMVLFTMGHGT